VGTVQGGPEGPPLRVEGPSPNESWVARGDPVRLDEHATAHDDGITDSSTRDRAHRPTSEHAQRDSNRSATGGV
jgi:hypothetical protein